jgi:hypothetical protein
MRSIINNSPGCAFGDCDLWHQRRRRDDVKARDLEEKGQYLERQNRIAENLGREARDLRAMASKRQ